jgi:hypothetical protein
VEGPPVTAEPLDPAEVRRNTDKGWRSVADSYRRSLVAQGQVLARIQAERDRLSDDLAAEQEKVRRALALLEKGQPISAHAALADEGAAEPQPPTS